MELYGKLSKEQLKDLDALLLELRKRNETSGKRKIIPLKDIVPLDKQDNDRLIQYLTHYCKLLASWPNHRRAICSIAQKDGVPFEETENEAVLEMTIFLYRYVWRHYEHSEECGYVFSTAEFGWSTWLSEQNERINGNDNIREICENYSRRRGGKVRQNNPD